MRPETRVGVAVTAAAVVVVSFAGLITPGHHASLGALAQLSDENGVPIASKVPYDCRADDAPHLTALSGHQHAPGFDTQAIAVLSPSTCATLEHQLTLTAAAARTAPTLADAQRLGFKEVGYYTPGLGIHMQAPEGIDGTFDPAHPEYFLYGGNYPSSPIVGFAFSVEDPRGIPALFAGGHDVPHSHGYCPAKPGQPVAQSPGQGDCTRANAIDGDDWLVHTWAVPGKPSPWGVFADANPALTPHGYDLRHPMTAKTLDCYYDTSGYEKPYPGCARTSA